MTASNSLRNDYSERKFNQVWPALDCVLLPFDASVYADLLYEKTLRTKHPAEFPKIKAVHGKEKV